MAGAEIERLIQHFAKLPGLGPRSARRVVLFLIKRRESLMLPLALAMLAMLVPEKPFCANWRRATLSKCSRVFLPILISRTYHSVGIYYIFAGKQ